MATIATAAVPDHVPAELVFDFDLYHDSRMANDLHGGMKTLHRDAPDIFYTPRHGGHWVLTRQRHMQEVLKDYERFTSSQIRIPKAEEPFVNIPLNLDPPEHTGYRQMLNKHFGPMQIKAMQDKIRGWARRLVSDVADKEAFDFADAVGTLYPVSIFMELMGLPLDRLRPYRAMVVEYFDDVTDERRMELEAAISAEMREVLEARMKEPRDDLASKFLAEEINGRKMSMDEMERLTNLLFQAGMDTVANFASFFFLYLGQNPGLQQRIREDRSCIPAVVEEGFRMFGVVNNGRMACKDTQLDGVEMKNGDMVVCMLPLVGLDETTNPESEDFKVKRSAREYMIFSQGPHLCVGHMLARAEMRILLEEWFAQIPAFHIAEGFTPPFRAGMVMGLAELPVVIDRD